MDAKNSLDLESVKDELRLLTKSDQFYSKIKSAVLPETIGVTAFIYKIGWKCFCDPTVSKLKTIAN